MTIYQYVFVAGFFIFLLSGLFIIYKQIRAGAQKDYSHPLGKIGPAVFYSFTGGMSPRKKESAYLHLPTYIAGILYHIGTFIAFIYLVTLFFNIDTIPLLKNTVFFLLVVTGLCGVSILLKRIFKLKLRHLSNPDDYISNLMVTGFQFLMALTVFQNTLLSYLFIYATVLLLYIPISKLRHSIYFFISRIHLGMFYGWRGVWPLKKQGGSLP